MSDKDQCQRKALEAAFSCAIVPDTMVWNPCGLADSKWDLDGLLEHPRIVIRFREKES